MKSDKQIAEELIKTIETVTTPFDSWHKNEVEAVINILTQILTKVREEEREINTELFAEYIYERMLCDGVKPNWTVGGNNLKQDEVRTLARETLLPDK